MYTISRFSQLCKMSARMLRHYDKEDLLKPVHVDTTNGYRYYEKDQLETALRIKKLKEYKFSLPEIKSILQTSDKTFFPELMVAKVNELSDEMNRYRQIISEMQEMMETNTDIIRGERRPYDIWLGMRNEIIVLSQRLQANIKDMDKYVDALYEKAEKEHIQLLSAPSAIFFDEEFIPDHSDVELIIPVAHVKDNDGSLLKDWTLKKWPEAYVATTLHIGSYDNIGYAHIALEEWTEGNGYHLVSPPYETYLKGPECDCPVEEYVTQVFFPVAKAAKK
ncbi:MerR family transcriptional regulator [Paenibacillus sp. SC116]|uniref:MerR family transcriptional regulator n=1 Tax=Paenibacillus sp. SC116 TaxID=2968986 RepID=UPI00215B55A2|nr:MerR family transcriptional regulator [Paenibacillus sp. SC116]MCR8844467.1 MerR family transcriptional regulator [Paenibacillus sp. SC116]